MTPSKRRIYLTGALAARDFLCRTQSDLHRHQRYEPNVLRWELANSGIHPPEYRAGFLDAIGAYVLMTLEDCQVNPETWEVLTAVERAGESQ